MFPTLPGIKAERSKSPAFSTTVNRAASGRRVAIGHRLYPVWRFKLGFNFLRASLSAQELQTLQGFFLARRGALESFLLKDRDLNAVTAQPFGVGNGVARSFPLLYSIGGTLDRIGDINPEAAAPTFSVGGTTTAGTVSNGVVTFATAPANSAPLLWSGSFCYRVAFEKDDLEFAQFLKDLHRTGVDLETTNEP